MKKNNRQLLDKFIRGEACGSEKEQVLRWIDQNGDHMKEYLAVRRLWDLSVWNTETIPGILSHSCPRPKERPFTRLARYAAVFAATLVLGTIAGYFLRSQTDGPQWQKVSAPIGQRAVVELSDGTKVWLNSGSSLDFPTRFPRNERTVTLDGEGYFEVAKNPRRPFVVATKKYDIKVTGTTFNLYSYAHSDIFEVSLLEGRISVRPAGEQAAQYIALYPGEKFCDLSGKPHKGFLKNSDSFLWREGIYYFDNERYEDIFRKLEQYYDVKIEVKDKKVLDYRLTGKFRQKEGIDHIMRVIRKDRPQLNFSRDDKNDNISIY